MRVQRSVEKFARLMEKVLRDNDHKPGWRGCSFQFLWDRFLGEVEEVRQIVERHRIPVVSYGRPIGVKGIVVEEARHFSEEIADVANIGMMLSELFGVTVPGRKKRVGGD